MRIEDDVIVTATGARSMTNVPRTVADIEAVMAGAPWPPQQAAAAQPQHLTMAEQLQQAQPSPQIGTAEAQDSQSLEDHGQAAAPNPEGSGMMSSVTSVVQSGMQSLGLGKK